MLQFKACPRCRGDMETQKDQYGAYSQCLQCGYIREEEPMAAPSSGKRQAA